MKPYKDSPLWFCAANRTNWGYEYFWLAGGGFLAEQWQRPKSKRRSGADQATGDQAPFQLGRDYPCPLVRPVNLEVHLDKDLKVVGTEPAEENDE